MSRTVLVTGATGYIARHIVAALLNRGETVVGSARSIARDAEMRAALGPALTDPAALDRYRTVALDLGSDEGWAQALAGVDVLLHTASPFPLEQPKDAGEVIRPAVEGTRRALRAAHRAGIARVVLTSSVAAIMEGAKKTRFDETDWTPDDPALSPYVRSKTLAERAAWEVQREEAPEIELAVINPGFVQGPPLGESRGTSMRVIERLLAGRDPMMPRIGFPVCDVRDVAEAHVRAIDAPGAAGHRHIVADRFLWFADMARIVRDRVPGAKPATREAPDLLVRFLGLFDSSVRTILPQLGQRREADNTRLREVLGIAPRDAGESVAETAAWLAARG